MPIAGIGERLRSRRQQNGLRVVDVARQAGLSPSYISQVERNLVTPSVPALNSLAAVLGLPASTLLGDNQGIDDPSQYVVRKNGRKVIMLPGAKVRAELLSPDLQRRMEFIILHIPPGGSTQLGSPAHVGDQAAIILQGNLELVIGDQAYLLEPGDSVYLPMSLPHLWRNTGSEEAHGIWATTPPCL